MSRILPTILIAALLVGSGIYLNGRSSNRVTVQTSAPATPATPPAEASPVATETVMPPIPAGYSLAPFLTETQQQSFTGAEEVLEPNTDYAAIIVTNRGAMTVELYEDRAPVTVNNFVFLSLHRFYEGIVFHRVLDDFMAQTGDPTGTGMGGPGYQFRDEFHPELRHDSAGTLSMANAGPGTNGSQFFITFGPTPHLNDRHSVFGRVIENEALLDSIQRIDPNQPTAIARASETLADLAEQNITLAGAADTTVEAYLRAQLGAVPGIGQTFNIDGYTGVYGRVGNEAAAGFFPQPDVIEAVYIIQRPQP